MDKAYYQKKIIDLRAKIAKVKEQKKKDNEYYSKHVKSASTPSLKASYRKKKIDAKERNDRQIESYKKDIERAKENMKRCKK